jgi:hypothetical protein
MYFQTFAIAFHALLNVLQALPNVFYAFLMYFKAFPIAFYAFLSTFSGFSKCISGLDGAGNNLKRAVDSGQRYDVAILRGNRVSS